MQAYVLVRLFIAVSCCRRIAFSLTFRDTGSRGAYKPRNGLGQRLLNAALNGPLWKYVMVPQARATMISTARSNGIDWPAMYNWLLSQDGPWKGSSNGTTLNISTTHVPEYYKRPFHAYEDGNLCWKAAMEQEIASAAVGARNFPKFGSQGEDAFRASFDRALIQAGATKPDMDDAIVVDLGCGTGRSTRQLAANWPTVKQFIGIDLSPFMIEVGRSLLTLSPTSHDEGGTWTTNVVSDKRIVLQVGDATSTEFEDASIDRVQIQFVLHELPAHASEQVIDEAYRILKNNGELWITEMDFEAPACKLATAIDQERGFSYSFITLLCTLTHQTPPNVQIRCCSH
jgi:SAM-dependent methyltransferase